MKKVKIGALLLSFSAILSRFLGMIRDAVFANVFGLGEEGGIYNLDAYYAAFRIPDLLYSLLIAGALSAAFIPLFTKLTHKDKKKSFEFMNTLLNLLLVSLVVASIILFLSAPLLMKLIAPGFDQASIDLSVQLTRIMLLSPFFLGLSSLFQGAENTHKKFVGMSLAPLLYNLSIIAAAVFFGLSHGVYALAYGVVIGAFFHFLVQVPSTFSLGFRYSPVLNLKMKEVKEFFLLSVPRIFALSASQLALLVDTMIASLLVLGSVSIYNYALNLQALPYGVVAISFSVAVFSTMAEKSDEPLAFSKLIRSSLHSICYWVIPACVGIFLLSRELVELILGRGAFDLFAIEQTTLMLKIFIWAAIGQSFISLLARAFYAQNETKRPVIYALISIFSGIVLSLILIFEFAFPVWALAISGVLVASLQSVLLLFGLSKFVKISVKDLVPVKSILKMCFSTLFMAAFVLGVQSLNFALLWTLGLSGVLGALLYIGVLKSIGISPSLRES